MPVVGALQLTITPSTALYTQPVDDTDINVQASIAGGRSVVVLDFKNGDGLYARDLGTVFQWPLTANNTLNVWQPSIIPQPEGIYDRASDWDDGGHPGAKFVHGVLVEADSFGNAKTFMLQDSDTLSMHNLNECPATFTQQSIIAFSCTPFIAHSVRVISIDSVEWKVWSEKLVFEPWPEACLDWQTELNSLGMIGWAHAREINLPYISSAPVTLTLTFDAWPTINLTLPSSANLQVKTKITLPPNKWKLIGFGSSSVAPHRIFKADMQVKIKAWGSSDAYQILKPFGGQSATGATV